MTQEQKKSRQKKSQLLEVKQTDANTYLVQSQSDPELFYRVVLNGSNSCHCADFKRNRESDPSWACKHIAAALDLKAQVERVEAKEAQANGNGLSPKERINLEVAAMFGDQEAARKLNGQAFAPQVLETPAAAIEEISEEIPQEASGNEPLDPCSECGRLLPASEMIPWQAPNGSGLICPECYQAHKEIQSELRSLEETPAEPGISGTEPLPQPAAHCALCGGEFPLPRGSFFPCMSCEYRPRQGEDPGPHHRQARPLSPPAVVAPTLAEKIGKVNGILEAFGQAALEADHTGRVGYGTQYVIDALNQGLGPEGWRYELLDHQVGEKRALVQLALYVWLEEGSWFSKGPVFGSSQNPDPADALKGSISDALKKAASHWGIGSRAYRGELRVKK